MNIRELLEKRAAMGDQAAKLIEGAEKETRGLNAEEKEKYVKIRADIDGINDLITQERELSSALGAVPVPGQEVRETAKPKSASEDAYRAAFDVYLRHGAGHDSPLTQEQRKLVQEVRAASPLSAVTGDAGGYTVPQGFYNQLTEAMKWYGGMRASKATVLSTTLGNDLPIPTANDTSNVGELVAENTAVTQAVTEMAFGSVTLKARKYSSKTVLVPLELMRDSAFDIGAFVARKLGERIGRITNTKNTLGTGTNEPYGVVPASTAGVTGTTGQTLKVIYDDLVNLKHAVDAAYRANAQWMINDSTAAVLELIKDSYGRPLLNSTLQGIGGPIDGGSVAGGSTLLGYPVVINNDVAVMAANAKSILFGDFSNYYIRDVSGIQLFRIVDKYIETGQVGFLAYYWGDGALVDAGMHPIKYYANSAS